MKNQKKVKFVPYEKCSPAEKRRRDAKQRGSWNGVNPVSRIAPDRKQEGKKKQCRGNQCRGNQCHDKQCFDE